MTGGLYSSELVIVRPEDLPLVAHFLEQAPDAALTDVAWTCAKRAAGSSDVVAVVATSGSDLRTRLVSAAKRIADGAARIHDKSGTWWSREKALADGKLAFLFPGAFAYYPDMFRDLALRVPVCRRAFDELEEALGAKGPFSPGAFVFPPSACYRHDADGFSAGGYSEATVSVCAADYAAVQVLAQLGLHPDGVTGFGGGDLNALWTSGFMGDMKRPDRLAFYGLLYDLSSRIARGMPTPTGTAPDPEWFAKFASDLRKFASHWGRRAPSVPVYSCTTAEPLPEKVRKARELCAELWTHPPRFEDTMKRMYADGFRVFLEVGPRNVLSNAAREALRGTDAVTVAVNRVHRSGMRQFQEALGQLAACGAKIDWPTLFAGRRVRTLDLEQPLSVEIRSNAEMRLSRALPRMQLLGAEEPFASPYAEPKRTVNKAAARAEAIAARQRRQQQFDFGSANPFTGDAETVEQTPGVSVEIVKTFTLADYPFFADCALGAECLAYSDPALRGLVLLPLLGAAEIMAEVAQSVMPNRHVAAVDDLTSRRPLAFHLGRLRLRVRAERVAGGTAGECAVKVQLRGDAPDDAWTWPAVEGTFLMSDVPAADAAFVPVPLVRPRNVHWTANDIYPDRLLTGGTLQAITKADLWSEAGLDYEIGVPDPAGAAAHAKFPLWALDPVVLTAAADGFQLWRSHERFSGAYSFAFRLRRLVMHARSFQQGARLRCYLRLTGVTPNSHVADISATDGNGNVLFELRGYEEYAERVPEEYRRLLLSPATSYLTQALPADAVGTPPVDFATAIATDIPYPVFERQEELWLRVISRIVLANVERRKFVEMTGSVGRRTEWLFGRIAAKEAIRRFLARNYQARWMSADVSVWADAAGKPRALGAWKDNLGGDIDLAIAHTAQCVVAVVASNARVGVDVEARERDLSEEFTHGVFTDAELALATGGLNSSAAAVRFWCAKEAVSKALGVGIRYSPRELTVTAFTPETGAMKVELRGSWLENFKSFRGRSLDVASTVVKDHILATCFIPLSYF